MYIWSWLGELDGEDIWDGVGKSSGILKEGHFSASAEDLCSRSFLCARFTYYIDTKAGPFWKAWDRSDRESKPTRKTWQSLHNSVWLDFTPKFMFFFKGFPVNQFCETPGGYHHFFLLRCASQEWDFYRISGLVSPRIPWMWLYPMIPPWNRPSQISIDGWIPIKNPHIPSEMVSFLIISHILKTF